MAKIKVFWKILFFFPLLFLLAVFETLAYPFTSSVCYAQVQVEKHVRDHAEYFSEDEIVSLEAACVKYGEQSDANIVLLIEDGVPGKQWKRFLEDAYDAEDNELGDCVMVLLDINEEERRIEIQGYGAMEYIISDSRIDDIIDAIYDDLVDGDYYGALTAIPPMVYDYSIKGTASDARTHTQKDNENYDPYYYENKTNVPLFFLLAVPISFVIGGVSVAVMAYHSGGKTTTNFQSYQSPGSRGLIGRYDRYTHTTTTKRAKPKEDADGGGSSHGGGISSGGNSHSGGGRSF